MTGACDGPEVVGARGRGGGGVRRRAVKLHASATDLVWFSSAYLLTWAAAMLPLGSLGDRYGRRRVMIASLAAFGLASAWAAASGSAGMFIAARAVGGEMMIMSAKDSTLFTLNEVATAIWEAIDALDAASA